jgi:hypothetical protein
MPQAVSPKGKSMPKVVRVNAADMEAVLYRNLGNGRRLPFIWGTTVTLASGVAEVVISSGVKFNEMAVAAGIIEATPLSAAGGALDYYVDKDTVNNVVKLKAAAPAEDCDFDIIIMLGVAYNFLSTHTNQIFWKNSSVTLSP